MNLKRIILAAAIGLQLASSAAAQTVYSTPYIGDRVIYVDTVADMLALPAGKSLNGQVVVTKRYSTNHTVGDGSGNAYRSDTSEGGTPDGGFVINDTGTHWHAVDKSAANVMQFGAVGDGTADDTAECQAAVNAIIAAGGGRVVGAADANFLVSSAIVLGDRVELDLCGATITQDTDSTPVIRVSNETNARYWAIKNGNLGYSSQQTTAETGAHAVMLAGASQIASNGVIENLRIDGAYEGISLPSNTSAYAFLVRFSDIHIRNCANYGVNITGHSGGGHTNFSLDNVYVENTNTIATMKGYYFFGVNGLTIGNLACDKMETSPVYTFDSCFGSAAKLSTEQLEIAVSSGGSGVFQFTGSEFDVGVLYNYSPTIVLSGSGLGATLRAISGSTVRVHQIHDMQTAITDTSSDNYYRALASSSTIENDFYNTTQASGTAPNSTFAEFSNNAVLATGVLRWDGSVRREYRGGKSVGYGTAAPTANTWAVGDTVYNTAPSAGGDVGWVCTTAGTPGTWKAFGAIDP